MGCLFYKNRARNGGGMYLHPYIDRIDSTSWSSKGYRTHFEADCKCPSGKNYVLVSSKCENIRNNCRGGTLVGNKCVNVTSVTPETIKEFIMDCAPPTDGTVEHNIYNNTFYGNIASSDNKKK